MANAIHYSARNQYNLVYYEPCSTERTIRVEKGSALNAASLLCPLWSFVSTAPKVVHSHFNGALHTAVYQRGKERFVVLVGVQCNICDSRLGRSCLSLPCSSTDVAPFGKLSPDIFNIRCTHFSVSWHTEIALGNGETRPPLSFR